MTTQAQIAHVDGCKSHARIRYDLAMTLALKAAEAHDDGAVMVLVWDAIEAAKELRDARRLEVAYTAMTGAANRWEHDHG